MSYLLDTDVFIQAKNLHYGLDFCPAFWQWIIDNNKKARVFSIDKVSDEIIAGSDGLTDWAREHGDSLFRQTDTIVTEQFEKISASV